MQAQEYLSHPEIHRVQVVNNIWELIMLQKREDYEEDKNGKVYRD